MSLDKLKIPYECCSYAPSWLKVKLLLNYILNYQFYVLNALSTWLPARGEFSCISNE